MEVWINPACTKCRVAERELDGAGIDYTERRYLEDVPTVEELAAVLDRMGLEPWDVARPKETKEAGIDLPKDAGHRDDWLAAMVAHPITIQRPIITLDDGTTVIARDEETLGDVVRRASP
jgi:arsenate reductase (glutaredoxin)